MSSEIDGKQPMTRLNPLDQTSCTRNGVL